NIRTVNAAGVSHDDRAHLLKERAKLRLFNDCIRRDISRLFPCSLRNLLFDNHTAAHNLNSQTLYKPVIDSSKVSLLILREANLTRCECYHKRSEERRATRDAGRGDTETEGTRREKNC